MLTALAVGVFFSYSCATSSVMKIEIKFICSILLESISYVAAKATYMGALNLQYRKMMDKSAGLENAGLENGGQICRGGKCRTGN